MNDDDLILVESAEKRLEIIADDMRSLRDSYKDRRQTILDGNPNKEETTSTRRMKVHLDSLKESIMYIEDAKRYLQEVKE